MPIAVNNKEIVAINCEGREIVRAHAGLSLVFSKQQDLYGGMDISSIADLVMFRDLINTGTCIWNGVSTNTYKGNTIAVGGLGSTWYVTTDIDMSSVCSSSLGSWVPIGTNSRPFSGTIEGLNFTISNLYINKTTATAGLFGDGIGLTLLNLTINGNVASNGYAAICLARVLFSSTANTSVLTNIKTTGSITSSAAYSAGIVAYANSSLTATNNAIALTGCVNNATITGTTMVAGICGLLSLRYQSAIVYNCSNDGYISGSSVRVTGVLASVGGRNVYISKCVNSGMVSGADYVAGIVSTSISDIYACINTGAISGVTTVGGIVSEKDLGLIYNCINIGAIYGVNYIGGIVGRLAGSIAGGIVQACRNDGAITESSISGTTRVGGIAGAVGYGSLVANLNTAQLITTLDYNRNAGVISGDTSYPTELVSNFYDNTVETTYKAFSNLEDRAGEGEGRPTSNLLGTSLLGAGSGWTTDNWVFEAGEYPTPRMD